MHPLVQEVSMTQLKAPEDVPQFGVGDTVRVHFRIVEGEKERIQVFEGTVISRKNGTGPEAKFTVRRIAFNEAVERVFPLHSPRVEKVEVRQEGDVRRAKLHYLRDRVGKAARVKRKIRSAAELAKNAEAKKAAIEAKKAATAAAAAPAPAPEPEVKEAEAPAAEAPETTEAEAKTEE